MSIATGVTLAGRRQAEALMESAVVVTRLTGSSVDAGTGIEIPTFATIYAGIGRLRMADGRSNAVVAAGQQVAVQSPTLWLPVALSAAVTTDDIAVVTSPLDSNPVTVRVAGVHSQTHSTARRFPVEVMS